MFGRRPRRLVAPLLLGCATLLAAAAWGGSSTASSASSGAGGGFAGLVRVGEGRELFLTCRGSGSPTVVLISGFRGAYDDWTNVVPRPRADPRPSRSAVFPRLAASTRVCAYNRPGTIGFDGEMAPSSPVRQPTTAGDGVADLHRLLGAAGTEGPYVLVAHSWGGMIGYLYGREHPEEVAGMVLVDPGSVFLKATLQPAQWARFARGARQLGKRKILEAADYERSVEQIQAAPPAPKIPAAVLTSDHRFDFGAGGRGTWPAWLSAQNRLASALGAKHVTDTDSGHYIAGERPGLVIDQVRAVVRSLRASAR